MCEVKFSKKNLDIPYPCKLLLISFDLIKIDNYKILFTINSRQKSDLNKFLSIKYIFFSKFFNSMMVKKLPHTYPRHNLS